MGDYVKGKDYLRFSSGIQKGILLHRHIDSFTDNHPVVRHDKTFFSERYQKYAGVVTDILYDHYLATEWNKFSTQDLSSFIDEIHELILSNYSLLPEGLQRMVPYIIKNRWFYSYGTLEGVQSVLIGMSKGTSLPDESVFAIKVIREHYETLKKDFFEFFPQLIGHIHRNDFGDNGQPLSE